jgi:hypothetical protein
MDTNKQIHDVSASLFFVLAFAYVTAALALRNDYYGGLAIFFMRLLDMPFAFIALLYGGSGLVLQLNEENEENDSPWNIIIFAVCILLFGAVVFVNLAFPSRI